MSVHKTLGFILKREELRETSLILTVYTRDHGKLKLVSKGVRSPEQRFVSAYELFALDEVVFYEKKKKDFYLLSQCELVDFFPKIRNSLDRLAYATYFIELLDSVTPPGEKNERLYELLLGSLGLLSGRASPKRAARIFEIKLLSILGLMPRIGSCAACDKKTEKAKTKFSFKAGGLLCESCLAEDRSARPILPGTVNFMSCVEGLPFERVEHIKVSTTVGSEIERLLKGFISYHLDTRLKSAEFIAKIGA